MLISQKNTTKFPVVSLRNGCSHGAISYFSPMLQVYTFKFPLRINIFSGFLFSWNTALAQRNKATEAATGGVL